VALIAALASDAQLLLLDEPTGSGLRCAVDNASLNEVLRRLTLTGVSTLTCRPPTLEELFLRQYSGQPAAEVRT